MHIIKGRLISDMDKRTFLEIKRLVRAEKDTLHIEDIEGYLDKILFNAEFILSEQKGQVRGLVAYYCNDVETRGAYITMVCVGESFRNKKLGTSLAYAVLEYLRKKNFVQCELEVDKDNDAAYALYSKMGFRVVGDSIDKRRMRIIL